MSRTFNEIKRIVTEYNLNENGFFAQDIINRTNILNKKTIKTFIPKHARVNKVYFERIGQGLYRINATFL